MQEEATLRQLWLEMYGCFTPVKDEHGVLMLEMQFDLVEATGLVPEAPTIGALALLCVADKALLQQFADMLKAMTSDPEFMLSMLTSFTTSRAAVAAAKANAKKDDLN